MKSKTSATPTNSPLTSRGYPRPQLRRKEWASLDGIWDFAIDSNAAWKTPGDFVAKQSIRTPFAPETAASGVGDTGFHRAVWYRRDFVAPPLAAGHRLLLHFGAVDYRATVWVNGRLVAEHEGGYTPFEADITESLGNEKMQTVVVRAEDDPLDLAKPRGKQDWKLDPHSIWYPRTTGIWQPVWLEPAPPIRIGKIRWTPNVERWEIGFEAWLEGQPAETNLNLRVQLKLGECILAEDIYNGISSREGLHRRIALPDPGIDDFQREMLWSPTSPTLLDAHIELLDGDGRVCDVVESYTAMRSTSIQGDRFLLNGRSLRLRMVLDQGYWPDTGLTAPDDDALRRDVELAKAMGFNGVRKHQKIEDPRYLFWADRLGLLVWEEMPSAYRFGTDAVRRMTAEWTAAIERDFSHPCIIAWVPFNESWGVPRLPAVAAQRHFIRAMYHLTKALDPTRPVIGNDGWEALATDIIAIHDYDASPAAIERRYTLGFQSREELLNTLRPGSFKMLLDESDYTGQPAMLTEFGGIAYSRSAKGNWGYSRADSSEALAERYLRLLDAVRSIPLLSGFCYTQFTDTYQEANGLLYMDRTPKFPLEQISVATRGAMSEQDHKLDAAWRNRLAGGSRKGPADSSRKDPVNGSRKGPARRSRRG